MPSENEKNLKKEGRSFYAESMWCGKLYLPFSGHLKKY